MKKQSSETEINTQPRYELKDGYLTITVNTYNRTSEKLKYVIKRIRRNSLADFIKLYELLVEEYIYCNFGVGSIISSEKGWNLLQDIAKLVPVVSGGDTVPLNIEDLEDDYDMITMLFFTEDVTDEGVATNEGIKPSLLARLNHLDQGSMVGKGIAKTRERKSEEIAAVTQAMQAMNPVPETTTPTS